MKNNVGSRVFTFPCDPCSSIVRARIILNIYLPGGSARDDDRGDHGTAATAIAAAAAAAAAATRQQEQKRRRESARQRTRRLPGPGMRTGKRRVVWDKTLFLQR